MTDNSMSVGSFLKFALKNTKRYFFKYLILISITACLVWGLYLVFSRLFPETPQIIEDLLFWVLGIPLDFVLFLLTINLCRGKKINIMASVKAKSMTIPIFIIACVLCYNIDTILDIIRNRITYNTVIKDDFLLILFILLAVPSAIFFCMSILAPFLAIDQNMKPFKAISESIKLTKGHRMGIFKVFLLIWIIDSIYYYIASIEFDIIFIDVIFSAFYYLSYLFFLYPMTLLMTAYPYLKLTDQLDETDEANGEMRNEP
jgi:hypothetical protein